MSLAASHCLGKFLLVYACLVAGVTGGVLGQKAHDLEGEWDVVEMKPSLGKLYLLKDKKNGSPFVTDEEPAAPKELMKLVFSEGRVQLPGEWDDYAYRLSGNRVEIEVPKKKRAKPDRDDPFGGEPRDREQFIPSYLDLKWDKKVLVVTSAEVRGYGGKQVVYRLERPLQPVVGGQSRKWTSSKGTTFEGTLLGFRGKSGVLKNSMGREVEVLSKQLSQSDADFLLEQYGAVAAEAKKRLQADREKRRKKMSPFR